MPNDLQFTDNSRLARNKTPTPRITARVKAAVEAMVERGIPYNEAAAEIGLTTRVMRLALERPHVYAYYQAQLKVLRGSRAARNFHRLCEIADAENNMPAVQAIRALEQITEQTNNKQTNTPTPGITINIVAATPAQHDAAIAAKTIDETETT
jgi:hypothetical protein